MFDHVLIVANTQPEDAGQYKCAVINKAIVLDSFVITVEVYSKLIDIKSVKQDTT